MLDTFDLTGWQWVGLAVSAALIGVSKTGVPGAGILAVPLAAMTVPARASVGLVLPMLMFADLFAVVCYRRHGQWSHLLRLLPLTMVGLVVGFGLLNVLDNRQMAPVIGGIIVVMLLLRLRSMFAKQPPAEAPQHPAFAPVMGLTAGATTMLANAGGPVMTLYLLAMRLPKHQFIGTAAWFFFIVNWIKVPFYAQQRLITPVSLQTNLLLLPAVACGAAAGIYLLNRIPQRLFNALAMVLAAASAIRLLLG